VKNTTYPFISASNPGQAAVVRLCQALKETHNTLKRLTDQTESEEGTLHANALPPKKRSLAFVLTVLKHNVSPETTDKMISNLREMQTEIRDRLKNVETSFNDVQDSYVFFHQQLVRVPTSGSTVPVSTTLTARVQLPNWLDNFRGRGFSERRRKGNSEVSPLNLVCKGSGSNYLQNIASHLLSGRSGRPPYCPTATRPTSGKNPGRHFHGRTAPILVVGRAGQI